MVALRCSLSLASRVFSAIRQASSRLQQAMACPASRSSCSNIRLPLASTSFATGSWADARNRVSSLRQMLMVLLPVFFQQLIGTCLVDAVDDALVLVFVAYGF